MKTYTEKRFFKWVKDDVSVTLRERSGSYGGGSEVFVIQRVYDASRRHSFEEYTDICETVQAHYGTGGNNVPVVLQNNQNNAIAKDTETCYTLTAAMGMGGGYVPMVVENCWCIGNGQVDQLHMSPLVGALNCMHDQQAVMTEGGDAMTSVVRRLTPLE